jgi:hypothetical protein
MTVAAISSSLLFNFTTNGNGQLLRERFAGIVEDPAMLGVMLAGVYVIASFAQVAVGLMIDRYPLKPLRGHRALQVRVRAAANAGWAPSSADRLHDRGVRRDPFTDAMIVRYVDDRMRSRVTACASRVVRRELRRGWALGRGQYRRLRRCSSRWPRSRWSRWRRSHCFPRRGSRAGNRRAGAAATIAQRAETRARGTLAAQNSPLRRSLRRPQTRARSARRRQVGARLSPDRRGAGGGWARSSAPAPADSSGAAWRAWRTTQVLGHPGCRGSAAPYR